MPENSFPPENAPPQAIHDWGELRLYSGIPPEGSLNDSLARTLIHGYYACVSYIDQQVGLILNKLEELKLDKNTIVILWGDHGWNLREHGLWCKHCNFRTSLRSTLMIKVPGKTKGQNCNVLVEFVDIYPTLCELAKLDLPDHLEGRSFASLIENPNQEWKDFVICKWFDGMTIKTAKYAYTEWSKTDTTIYARMLYNHRDDISENINISESEEEVVVIRKLSQLLHENWGRDFNKSISVIDKK